MLIRLLVAVDAPSLEHRLFAVLDRPDVLVQRAGSHELWELLGRESFDLVVVSRSLLGDIPEHVIATIRALPDRPEVIALLATEDPGERAALQAAGAFATVNERLPVAAMRDAFTTLVERRREAALARLRAERPAPAPRLSDLATGSSAMDQLVQLARRLAPTDSSVLVLGETGVGKELLARALHAEGPRAASPFIAVNCAAVPEGLLESELFGHEKGAFTGAVRPRRGHFELAHRGTLFLDEIGDMALHLQAKLLRALQERRIQRVGSEQGIDVDVRILAATNRDLEAAMQAGQFRRDLYYRLGVVSLTVPPLRERREDIPNLADRYLARFRGQLGRPQAVFAPAAIDALVRYDWPGNVRELVNVIERAVLLAPGPTIGLADLPRAVAAPAGGIAARSPASPPATSFDMPLAEARRELLEAFERDYLQRALAAAGGHVGRAADRAGIDSRTLFNKMRRYGLRKEDFRRR